MHDQVRQAHRVQRRAERLDELVGQLADEADRVGDEHGLATGERELPGARVEGDEEPVLGRDTGVGEPVEQRRLAGVGVADQGQLAVAAAGAAAPLQRPGALHLAQVGLQLVHAPDEAPAVDFELRLARAPRPDATRLLAQRGAAAAQARQPVAQERELHLRLALGAAGVLGEDVEDHRGAVDGRAAEQLLEVAVLRRRQLVVEYDRVRVEAPAQLGDLLGLAPPDEGGGVGRVAPLHDAADHVGTRAVHQPRQLVQLLVDHLLGQAGEDHPDENDPLPEGPLDERPRQQVAQESIPGWMVTSATLRTGPARYVVAPSSAPSVTSRIPPGLRTRTVLPSGTAPQLRAAAAAATLPVPQARVSPAPRSHTRNSRSSPSPSRRG